MKTATALLVFLSLTATVSHAQDATRKATDPETAREQQKAQQQDTRVKPPADTTLPVAKDKRRDYLLEAIVIPNKTIAKNFETAVLVDENGKIHTGIVKSENDEAITLVQADGRQVTILTETIELRRAGRDTRVSSLTVPSI